MYVIYVNIKKGEKQLNSSQFGKNGHRLSLMAEGSSTVCNKDKEVWKKSIRLCVIYKWSTCNGTCMQANLHENSKGLKLKKVIDINLSH